MQEMVWQADSVEKVLFILLGSHYLVRRDLPLRTICQTEINIHAHPLCQTIRKGHWQHIPCSQ